MTRHPEVSTWVMWHDTWMLMWHDTWMMTSSSSFPHRPSTNSLGQPKHLADFGRCRTIDTSTIDDFSCLIQTLHQNSIDPRPSTHRPSTCLSATENTLLDSADPRPSTIDGQRCLMADPNSSSFRSIRPSSSTISLGEFPTLHQTRRSDHRRRWILLSNLTLRKF
jgi:hypothetical protein